MKEPECARLAECMLEAFAQRSDASKLSEIREEVRALARAFPVPESFV